MAVAEESRASSRSTEACSAVIRASMSRDCSVASAVEIASWVTSPMAERSSSTGVTRSVGMRTMSWADAGVSFAAGCSVRLSMRPPADPTMRAASSAAATGSSAMSESWPWTTTSRVIAPSAPLAPPPVTPSLVPSTAVPGTDHSGVVTEGRDGSVPTESEAPEVHPASRRTTSDRVAVMPIRLMPSL